MSSGKPSRWIEMEPLGSIERAAKNPKDHALGAIGASLDRFGYGAPIARDERTGRLVFGHGRLEKLAAMKQAGDPPPEGVGVTPEGEWLVPVYRGWASKSDDEADAFLLADNKISEVGGWKQREYEDMVAMLEARGGRLATLGWSQAELADIAAAIEGRGGGAPPHMPSLRDRFVVPPFSVLDARQGYWKDRKAQWLAIGIQSELGRGDTGSTSARAAPGESPTYRQIGRKPSAAPGGSPPPRGTYPAPDLTSGSGDPPGAAEGPKRRGTNRAPLAASFGQDLMRGKGEIPSDGLWPGKRKKGDASAFNGGKSDLSQRVADRTDGDDGSGTTGTSIFDPVLCELAYRWFVPPGGIVVDPFAGGSVRGIVAGLLGLRYFGVDLRGEQVMANEHQAAIICAKADARPAWAVGDSRGLAKLVPTKLRRPDFFFSCPPYAMLERYSDDPRDLSTLGYDEFRGAYGEIIAAGVGMLKDDRFACFVVGDVRDERGNYYALPADTIRAFRAAGAELYNDAVLVTAIGSLPIRVGKQFVTSRKLGNTHQRVLVFCKGDPRKATEACGKITIEFPASMAEDVPPPPAAATTKYGEEMP